ncbi:MAG: hypothetical protein CVU47_00420 [Chloroflexi bacterium HGW-Chloroflexi-9]|nr:MAG: hypothetical protein CVU47_00420 [Chloroflexi bacterium HGW-Chloroflexi-9]
MTRFEPMGEQVIVEMTCYQSLDSLNVSLQTALDGGQYSFTLRCLDSTNRVHHTALVREEAESLWSLLRFTGTDSLG